MPFAQPIGRCIQRIEKDYENFLGGDSDRATPVPIPNTEVKPVYVDGTARETEWESRKLPGLNEAPSEMKGLFFVLGRAFIQLYDAWNHLIASGLVLMRPAWPEPQ